jgi:hypothetical protein
MHDISETIFDAASIRNNISISDTQEELNHEHALYQYIKRINFTHVMLYTYKNIRNVKGRHRQHLPDKPK